MRILITDGSEAIRKQLRSVVEQQPDMKVIGEAEDGQSAYDMALRLRPDVIIMDIILPKGNGMEITRQIREKIPDIKILAISAHSSKHYIMEMLKSGAYGYILKDCSSDILLNAIRKVINKKIYIGPSIVRTIARDYIKMMTFNYSLFHVLSDNELTLLRFLIDGENTDETIHDLFTSQDTTELHFQYILDIWLNYSVKTV